MPQRLHLTQKSHCKSFGYLFAYVLGNALEAGGLADVRPPGAKLFNRVIHRFGGYALSMAVLLDLGPRWKLGRIHEGLIPRHSARHSGTPTTTTP